MQCEENRISAAIFNDRINKKIKYEVVGYSYRYWTLIKYYIIIIITTLVKINFCFKYHHPK